MPFKVPTLSQASEKRSADGTSPSQPAKKPKSSLRLSVVTLSLWRLLLKSLMLSGSQQSPAVVNSWVHFALRQLPNVSLVLPLF